jgi:hypothetical protein
MFIVCSTFIKPPSALTSQSILTDMRKKGTFAEDFRNRSIRPIAALEAGPMNGRDAQKLHRHGANVYRAEVVAVFENAPSPDSVYGRKFFWASGIEVEARPGANVDMRSCKISNCSRVIFVPAIGLSSHPRDCHVASSRRSDGHWRMDPPCPPSMARYNLPVEKCQFFRAKGIDITINLTHF